MCEERGQVWRALAKGEEVMRRLSLLCGLCVAAVSLVLAPVAGAAGFGLQSFEAVAVNQDGSPDVQAGSHPYEFTTRIALNESEEIAGTLPPHNYLPAGGGPRDVRVQLPPGFSGNPNATPKCSYHQFSLQGCPDDTAVGEANVGIGVSTGYEKLTEPGAFLDQVQYQTSPVYNVEPPGGVVLELGFYAKELSPVLVDASVSPGGGYAVTLNSRAIQGAVLNSVTFTVWGVPEEASHNAIRGNCLGPGFFDRSEVEEGGVDNEHESRGECPTSALPRPFLTLPTSCGVPQSVALGVDSWEEPGVFDSKTAALPPLTGCEKLGFDPSIRVAPDGSAGSTPTGLGFGLHFPQEVENPAGLWESDLQGATVALPAGVQVSPSAADGLMACSQEQVALNADVPAACPEASKVALVRVKTPVLEHELTGAVYLASPQNFAGGALENPFGSLLALYLVTEDPASGVLVKLAGRVTLDPVTGQLMASFQGIPPLPFSDLSLEFFAGSRAPLTTPAVCGTYTTQASFQPWSGGAPATPSSNFQVSSGPADGVGCSTPASFTPGFQAGTTDVQAGAFSPFTLSLTRPDGDQTLSSVEVRTPPGLLGILAGVKLCGEAQANAGTCGEESLVGHTVVSVGLGSDPYTVTGGRVYITAGYGGAPYGLSIVTPAAAGPFVLEEGRPVVVRAGIYVDPHTAALRVLSGALPRILDGIPLQIQRVNVTIERPGGFTFNPTSCERMAVTGILSGGEGASAAVSSPFQVADCAGLPFHPAFTVSTQARTSKHDGASLTVKGAFPAGNANIHSVAVTLPKQLPARLTTIQQACPEATFAANPAGCPAGSEIGVATAKTPVLSNPVTGPAYLVSHGGAAFPDLVLILQGEGVTIDLTGSIDIKHGVTSSTFATVPDAPISAFTLTLPEGPHSGLAAVVPAKAKGSLCGQSLAMPFTITGQNGAVVKENNKIAVTGCPRAKKKAKHKKRRKAKR